MVTAIMLQESLNKFLETEIANKMDLKSLINNRDIIIKNPQIIFGFILPNDINNNDIYNQYPYISTNIEKIERLKNIRQKIVTVRTEYGIYCPGSYDDNEKIIQDGSGYRDIWNLIERTEQALFSQRILDNRYEIVSDYFESGLYDSQPYPYWQGYCLTKWEVATTLPKTNFMKGEF